MRLFDWRVCFYKVMTTSCLSGVRVAGLASAVPELVQTLADDARTFGEDMAKKISENSGVLQRHIASENICTSDLCFVAAERLITELNWERKSIDGLIVVTQTPDYFLPATSCSLHGRLKLATHCAAFDVNLGCSGYVYGLWLASHLIASASVRRLLLLAGDTATRFISPYDHSVSPLFGDAGTATAVERDMDADPIAFQLGTDGRGQKHAIIPAGAFRQPRSETTARRTLREGGNVRSDEELFMNGAGVVAFTLREVPALIKSVLDAAGWSDDTVDAFVLHQANRMLLQCLLKRMRVRHDKVVFALEEYGNTSSASLPLTMTHCLRERLNRDRMRLVLASFGNGFSWGAVTLTCGPMIMPELLLVADQPSTGYVTRESQQSHNVTE